VKYSKNGRVFNGYVHVFVIEGQCSRPSKQHGVSTFENDTDDPPLFIWGSTVVDLLEDIRLFILLSYILGYLVKISIQVINRESSLDDG
jgi:hypothetical protein